MTFSISLVVRGRKAPESICPTSIAGVLPRHAGTGRLRAINSLICDRSARRFAPAASRGRQDDASLEGIEKHLVGSKKHGKIEKVTSSQDDDFVGVLTSPRVPKGYYLHSFRTLSAFPPFSFSISASPSHSAASFRNFLPCVFGLNG